MHGSCALGCTAALKRYAGVAPSKQPPGWNTDGNDGIFSFVGESCVLGNDVTQAHSIESRSRREPCKQCPIPFPRRPGHDSTTDLRSGSQNLNEPVVVPARPASHWTSVPVICLKPVHWIPLHPVCNPIKAEGGWPRATSATCNHLQHWKRPQHHGVTWILWGKTVAPLPCIV